MNRVNEICTEGLLATCASSHIENYNMQLTIKLGVGVKLQQL